jgi:putative two-component system response regulator
MLEAAVIPSLTSSCGSARNRSRFVAGKERKLNPEQMMSQYCEAEWPRPPRILVVVDEQLGVRLVGRVLATAGYEEVVLAMDALAALSTVRFGVPDLVVLDLHMPGFDGFQVLRELHRLIPANDFVPVLVLTGDLIPDTRKRALALGATDFLTKPFDNGELILRIHNMLRTRLLHISLTQQKNEVESALASREVELEEARLELLERLALAAELRDTETGRHLRAVGDLSETLALGLGFPAREARVIGRAARLHDIGKIGVPDGTLLNTGPLSARQLLNMRAHTIVGEQLLSGGDSPMMATAACIARHHHERWDGSGYPDGISGDLIPVPARIVAVADVFDALIHDRPYRKAWSQEAAIELILGGSGTHFDPAVVNAFASLDWVAARAARELPCAV